MGKKRQRFQIPDGWVARGYRLEVAPTSPAQWPRIAQHFGARRFAYNWALAYVKANLDAHEADAGVPLVAWTLPTLRLGVGQEWAVVAHADGSIQRVAHPAPWARTQTHRRWVARQLNRRIVGSRGYRQAKAKLAALDRRAANLRRESIHTMTTALTRRYGVIVIEDLDVAAMLRSMGRRAFHRTVAQAGIGAVRPPWPTRRLGVADGSCSPTAGSRPPRPTTAVAGIARTCG